MLGWEGGSVRKESTCSAGDMGLIPEGGKSPGEGNGNPLQGKSQGQRSQVGYSPWGHKIQIPLTDQTTINTHYKILKPLGDDCLVDLEQLDPSGYDFQVS